MPVDGGASSSGGEGIARAPQDALKPPQMTPEQKLEADAARQRGEMQRLRAEAVADRLTNPPLPEEAPLGESASGAIMQDVAQRLESAEEHPAAGVTAPGAEAVITGSAEQPSAAPELAGAADAAEQAPTQNMSLMPAVSQGEVHAEEAGPIPQQVRVGGQTAGEYLAQQHPEFAGLSPEQQAEQVSHLEQVRGRMQGEVPSWGFVSQAANAEAQRELGQTSAPVVEHEPQAAVPEEPSIVSTPAPEAPVPEPTLPPLSTEQPPAAQAVEPSVLPPEPLPVEPAVSESAASGQTSEQATTSAPAPVGEKEPSTRSQIEAAADSDLVNDQEYQEKLKALSGLAPDDPRRKDLQEEVDEIRKNKLLEKAQAGIKGGSLDAVRMAAGLTAPDKGFIARKLLELKTLYAAGTDKRDIVDAGESARKLWRYYWQNRKNPKFNERNADGNSERDMVMKAMRQDVMKYIGRRALKFVLKDYWLIAIGINLLILLGMTYAVHKLAGGK